MLSPTTTPSIAVLSGWPRISVTQAPPIRTRVIGDRTWFRRLVRTCSLRGTWTGGRWRLTASASGSPCALLWNTFNTSAIFRRPQRSGLGSWMIGQGRLGTTASPQTQPAGRHRRQGAEIQGHGRQFDPHRRQEEQPHADGVDDAREDDGIDNGPVAADAGIQQVGQADQVRHQQVGLGREVRGLSARQSDGQVANLEGRPCTGPVGSERDHLALLLQGANDERGVVVGQNARPSPAQSARAPPEAPSSRIRASSTRRRLHVSSKKSSEAVKRGRIVISPSAPRSSWLVSTRISWSSAWSSSLPRRTSSSSSGTACR